MNPSSSARQRLGLLLPQWQGLLQGWAASGELVAAAREALHVDGQLPLHAPQAPARAGGAA